MGFITIYDDYETVDVTLFGNEFKQYYAVCEIDSLVLMEVIVRKYQQKITLALRNIEIIEFNKKDC